MRRFLVVVNQTLGGEQLGRAVLERAAAGPSRFFIIVPATPPREHLTWSEGGARAIADHRLKRALARIHALGVEANGEIGDANPLLAVGDAWRHERFDEIILFSPTRNSSRWLKIDLPRRVRSAFGVRVLNVASERYEDAQ